MSSVGEIYNSVVNFTIEKEWHLDKQRAYRQVNEFNFFAALISISGVPLAALHQMYAGLILQIFCLFCYLGGFYLISKRKLRKARLLGIYTFETHLFLFSFSAVVHTDSSIMPSYSPLFLAYMLYPLIAALFDKSIIKHALIALVQILLVQLLSGVFTDAGFPVFPAEKQDTMIFLITIYTIVMASAIIYLIYSENRNVKNLEIKRSEELEAALREVETNREMISRQAAELKTLNDSKDKFFSIITHDLKAPYNTLLGFSEMLKDNLDKGSKNWEYANNLHESALNNYNLVENLIEWSRSQRGRIPYNPTNFVLNEVVFKTVNLISLNAEKKDISIHDYVGNDLKVHADRNLVNIIIRNILTNAIKYSYPEGEIIISAKASEKFAEISISDNGIGIPEGILKTLFSIENKNSRTGTDHETGTGLGLILCKEFIDLHGCSIWAESEVKKGSVFHFTLPLVNGE